MTKTATRARTVFRSFTLARNAKRDPLSGPVRFGDLPEPWQALATQTGQEKRLIDKVKQVRRDAAPLRACIYGVTGDALALREWAAQNIWDKTVQTGKQTDEPEELTRLAFIVAYGEAVLRWLDALPASEGHLDTFLEGGVVWA